jgi:hypothetical protein
MGVRLEINTKKTVHVIMSCHKNTRQNHSIKTADSSFENVAVFNYLRTILTDQNVIHEEIKSRLNLGEMLATIQFRIFVFPSAVQKQILKQTKL